MGRLARAGKTREAQLGGGAFVSAVFRLAGKWPVRLPAISANDPYRRRFRSVLYPLLDRGAGTTLAPSQPSFLVSDAASPVRDA